MKKIMLSMIFGVMFLMSVNLVLATESWDVTGTYTIVFSCTSVCSGDYPHTMEVDVMSLDTGDFTATGIGINDLKTWTATGTVTGDAFLMNIDYDINSYFVDLDGTIAPGGAMSGTAISSSGQTFTWETTAGTATFVRTAEIISPEENEEVSGMVSFDATLVDKDGNDNVQWAVRKGTCTAGVANVIGNVDGSNSPYSWDGTTFHALADTSSWELGDYCFIFNPTESAGDTLIREIRNFVLVDNTAPIITFVEPLGGSIQNGVINLKATCNEDCSYVNFWWRAADESFAWYRYHYVHDDGTVFEWGLNTLDAQKADGSTYLMEDGTYYLYAAGTDLAGNWARTPEIMVVVDNDDDGVLEGDRCPGTVTDVPTEDLGVNRHVWYGGENFTTLVPAKKGTFNPADSEFSIADTYGCSCEQILDSMSETLEQDFEGHYKFGCSKGLIEDWISGRYHVGPTVIETVEVPATSEIPIESINSLELGKDYFLKAYGTAWACDQPGCNIEFDAEYSTSDGGLNWVDGVAAPYTSHGLDLLDLKVDGTSMDWGAYNSEHTYQIPYTGTGNSLFVVIYDLVGSYSNNDESLFVDIIEDKWFDLW